MISKRLSDHKLGATVLHRCLMIVCLWPCPQQRTLKGEGQKSNPMEHKCWMFTVIFDTSGVDCVMTASRWTDTDCHVTSPSFWDLFHNELWFKTRHVFMDHSYDLWFVRISVLWPHEGVCIWVNHYSVLLTLDTGTTTVLFCSFLTYILEMTPVRSQRLL